MPLTLQLTPHGHLTAVDDDAAMPIAAEIAARLRETFARGEGHGLLQLGAEEVETVLPVAFGYWRDVAARFVTAACGRPGRAARRPRGIRCRCRHPKSSHRLRLASRR